jgi:DNA-binding IclR family transcriptional regulator
MSDGREKTRDVIQAAHRVLRAEEVLLRAFAYGLAAGELAKALSISPPAATRCLKTLEHAGRAERVPETNRWRASHRLGRLAIQAVHSLDRAASDAADSRQRLDPDGTVPVQTL